MIAKDLPQISCKSFVIMENSEEPGRRCLG